MAQPTGNQTALVGVYLVRMLTEALAVMIEYLLHCDGFGVSYAASSKLHVISDVSVATQRLRIPKQPKCWKPQQR
jgi:hypothetical protein